MCRFISLIALLCAIDVPADGGAGRITFESGGDARSVRAGETLSTGKTGNATLELEGGSRLILAPETEITLQSHSEAAGTEVLMQSGLIYTSVTPTRSGFHIRTPSAVIGVRGTEFTVETAPSAGTTVHTFFGEVAFEGNHRTVLLKADQRSVMSSSAPGPTEPARFEQAAYLGSLKTRAGSFSERVRTALDMKHGLEQQKSGAGRRKPPSGPRRRR